MRRGAAGQKGEGGGRGVGGGGQLLRGSCDDAGARPRVGTCSRRGRAACMGGGRRARRVFRARRARVSHLRRARDARRDKLRRLRAVPEHEDSARHVRRHRAGRSERRQRCGVGRRERGGQRRRRRRRKIDRVQAAVRQRAAQVRRVRRARVRRSRVVAATSRVGCCSRVLAGTQSIQRGVLPRVALSKCRCPCGCAAARRVPVVGGGACRGGCGDQLRDNLGTPRAFPVLMRGYALVGEWMRRLQGRERRRHSTAARPDKLRRAQSASRSV
eukprot:6116744-Prymnesium_polylepis.1